MDDGDQTAEELFASLDFKGLRFENANLPVECLENIASYERILKELAAEIWRELNPVRARLPRGFKDHLSLSLNGIKSGSAVAEIKRDPSVYAGLPLNYHGIDFMSLAQRRFLKAVIAANTSNPINPLPRLIKADIARLASNIRNGEQLDICPRPAGSGYALRAKYTTTTRDRLISAIRVSGVKEISGIAIVTAIDDALERIKLTSEFGVFYFRLERAKIRRDFCDALNRPVEFSARVMVAQSGAIKSVIEEGLLHLLEVGAEGQRLSERLRFLETLREGWRDGSGVAVNRRIMDWARDIAGFLSSKYQGISSFAQEDGTITFEFAHGAIEVIVSIKEEVINVDAFDDSDLDMRSQAFFAVTPKLLSVLSDLREFLL